MSDNTQIERPMTNMGWPGRHTWHYTHLTSSEVDAQLTHLASPTLYMDVGADSVTIQPSTAKSSEDRLSVQAWNLPSGTWTFAAVFDGASRVPALRRF